jgi:photosystem II stability/assembly factor-like uncharacterized protein
MVNYFIIIILFAFVMTKSEWVGINVPPRSEYNFLSITWSNKTAIVAGTGSSSSVISWSNDVGLSWTTSSSSFAGFIYDISSNSVNGIKYAIAPTTQGKIYHSLDEGKTWKLNATIPVGLYGVAIGPNGNAFVCGNAFNVYGTTLPSRSWQNLSPGAGSGTFYDISTYDGTNIIAVGTRGFIYYSSSSGSSGSWTAASSGVTTTIYCVSHGDAYTAIAAGTSSYVAKTTNGGALWTVLSVYSSSTVITYYHSISFLDVNTVFIAGNNGEIYQSINCGSTWIKIASIQYVLYSISMVSNTKGLAGAVAGRGVYTLVTGLFFRY